jgi:hypothetical protein
MIPLSPLQKFGEWLPDRAPLDSGGATVAKNVYAIGEDYAPVKDLAVQTNALPAACRGSISVVASDGVAYSFAGTDTDLYQRDGSSWTEVTRASGGDYGGTSARWRFVQYGNYVLATNGVDTPQYFLIGTSTKFAALTGAPICRFLSVINNFVVASGIVANRALIKWSALDNPTDWTPSAATQSDEQYFYEAGAVTAVTQGQNMGVVIGTNGIGVMEYVGPPYIFTFRIVEPNRGSQYAGGVLSFSNGAFYYADDGFYFFNGSSSQPIGYDKVDEWFRLNATIDNIASMTSAIDKANRVALFGVPSATAGVCNAILAYSWVNGRFSYIEKSVEDIFQSLSEGVDADDLSSTNADDVDAFTDDASFTGGSQLLGAFDSSHRLCTFSGDNLEATIDTGEFQLNPNGRSFIGSTVLVGDYSTATVTMVHRALQTDTTSTTAPSPFQSSTGEAYFNLDSRYTRARVTLTGTWRRASGIKVRAKASGML